MRNLNLFAIILLNFNEYLKTPYKLEVKISFGVFCLSGIQY